MSLNLDELKKPFAPEAISWRLGSTNKEKTKGMALAYIDARDVMKRMDDVCGHLWQVEYVPMPNGTCCCRIGIFIGDEWIWRSNGSLNVADSEKADAKEMSEKGSYSDAFKRAAVLWGVGRYLYDLDSPWVEIEEAGRSFKIKQSEYTKLRKLLGGSAAPQSTPQSTQAAPQTTAKSMTAEQWVENAKQELTKLHTAAEFAAWMQKNSKAIDRLHEQDKALYNAINTHISIRNEEIQRQAGRKAA